MQGIARGAGANAPRVNPYAVKNVPGFFATDNSLTRPRSIRRCECDDLAVF